MSFIGGAFLLASALTSPIQQQPVPSQTPIIRRLAATAQLAAQEYRIGIVNGRVVSQAEVDEARLFLGESRRAAAQLGDAAGSQTVRAIDSLLHLVDQLAPPDSLDARVRRLADALSTRFGIALDELPAEPPSLDRGAVVYKETCAGCHGNMGRGDGPLAQSLDPRPADLADPAALRDQSPLDFYNKISIGVVGTAMPAFESRLSVDDRWAAALYASLLRLPPPSGETPATLRAFPTTGRMSDAEILAALGGPDRSADSLSRLAAVRAFRLDRAGSTAQVFSAVRTHVDSTYALATRGDTSAGTRAFDAYMAFEQVEPIVRARNPGLASELEAAFATLRTRAAGGASVSELSQIRGQLDAALERAEHSLKDDISPANLFLQSFVILLREGLEAILLIGALMTFLVKMGAAHRRREVNLGVAAAVVASLLTAFALETVFDLTPAKREVLEGVTMIAATAVLFYVSYWLLSKMEVAKWTQFVRSKVQDALTSGSGLALGGAAFLAVYREGFETVLFYKALFLTGSSPAATLPILVGILAGVIILAGVYVAIHRFGMRLPLKPFFGVTSGFLYYTAFVFGGRGVAELQEGGVVPATFIPGAPRVPALGIYPTLETLLVQGALLLLLIVGLVWTFVIEPRRVKSTSPRATEAPPARAIRSSEAP